MRREHQKGETDWQSLAKCVNATAAATPDEFQASSPYLRLLSQHYERIAEEGEMLVLQEERDGTNRVILPNSLIREVIEESSSSA